MTCHFKYLESTQGSGKQDAGGVRETGAGYKVYQRTGAGYKVYQGTGAGYWVYQATEAGC